MGPLYIRHMRIPSSVTLVTILFAACASGAARPTGWVEPATGSLRTAIMSRIGAVPGAEVAVSFRDLGTGDSLDLNATTEFHAASTKKIPVMLAVLRAVEAGRLSLDQGVPVVNRFASIVDGSAYSLDAGVDSDSSMYGRIGQSVPVRELLERMIVRSSNLATNTLVALVGAEPANAMAHELGATHMRVLRGVEDQKAYDRGLNNTTTSADLAVLLQRIERNEALTATSARLMREILLRQEFNDEIPAGLPKGIPVAHKTGSITATLHDAAIVYPPTRAPYVLVVLTRNIPDEKVARALIADVSRLVWTHVMAPSARAAR
ncbi:MAG: Beta-lactamase [Gemmatimonadetes bacterium]|nr:Beta-lactamase [Gemmatimonadota bacterium]